MRIKDFYHNGVDTLISLYRTLENMQEYGNKANAIFDNCSLTFFVSDVRGLEAMVMKDMASSFMVLNKNPFTKFNRMRPVVFSKDYPNVSMTEKYTQFFGNLSQVNRMHAELLTYLESNESENFDKMDAYKLNFAGSLSFDALVTFSGMNITTILGTFPSTRLKNKEGEFIDPHSIDFTNACIATFIKEFYARMESAMTSMDIFTDVSLYKMYFSSPNLEMKYPNRKGLIVSALHPLTKINIFTIDNVNRLAEEKKRMMDAMEFIDMTTSGVQLRDIPDFRSRMKYTICVRCSVQTLIYLSIYTNAVSYHTDIKSVIGVPGNIETVYMSPHITESPITRDIIKHIEQSKASLLDEIKSYETRLEAYNKNRMDPTSNVKLQKPVCMVNKIEYFNLTPLYAQTNVVLYFTENDLIPIPDVSEAGKEIVSIVTQMHQVVDVVKNFITT